MPKPPYLVVKSYPPRGPIQQHRFNNSTTFHCFRCGRAKTSKLLTTYDANWDKILCNGCYGHLISVYTIKAGTEPDDVRGESLARLLLSLASEDEAREATRRLGIRKDYQIKLSSLALRFIGTAEVIANRFQEIPNLDWSAAILGLCKAFELELVLRVIHPLRDSGLPSDFGPDIRDKDMERVAKYCAGLTDRPPELGAIAHFVGSVVNSRDRIGTSFLMKAYRRLATKFPHGDWLVSPSGLVSSASELAFRFRNPSVHIEELSRADYVACSDLLLGQDGMLWTLITATEKSRD